MPPNLPQRPPLFSPPRPAQSATDIAQIRELQAQLEEAQKEQRGLQEKVGVLDAADLLPRQSLVVPWLDWSSPAPFAAVLEEGAPARHSLSPWAGQAWPQKAGLRGCSPVWPQLQVSQARVAYLEQSMVERAIVSRQEALICDLENKLEFQRVQIKRFEVGGRPGGGGRERS